jgi:hypothetical protein
MQCVQVALSLVWGLLLLLVSFSNEVKPGKVLLTSSDALVFRGFCLGMQSCVDYTQHCVSGCAVGIINYSLNNQTMNLDLSCSCGYPTYCEPCQEVPSIQLSGPSERAKRSVSCVPYKIKGHKLNKCKLDHGLAVGPEFNSGDLHATIHILEKLLLKYKEDVEICGSHYRFSVKVIYTEATPEELSLLKQALSVQQPKIVAPYIREIIYERPAQIKNKYYNFYKSITLNLPIKKVNVTHGDNLHAHYQLIPVDLTEKYEEFKEKFFNNTKLLKKVLHASCIIGSFLIVPAPLNYILSLTLGVQYVLSREALITNTLIGDRINNDGTVISVTAGSTKLSVGVRYFMARGHTLVVNKIDYQVQRRFVKYVVRKFDVNTFCDYYCVNWKSENFSYSDIFASREDYKVIMDHTTSDGRYEGMRENSCVVASYIRKRTVVSWSIRNVCDIYQLDKSDNLVLEAVIDDQSTTLILQNNEWVSLVDGFAIRVAKTIFPETAYDMVCGERHFVFKDITHVINNNIVYDQTGVPYDFIRSKIFESENCKDSQFMLTGVLETTPSFLLSEVHRDNENPYKHLIYSGLTNFPFEIQVEKKVKEAIECHVEAFSMCPEVALDDDYTGMCEISVKGVEPYCIFRFPTITTSICSIPDQAVFVGAGHKNYLKIYCYKEGVFEVYALKRRFSIKATKTSTWGFIKDKYSRIINVKTDSGVDVDHIINKLGEGGKTVIDTFKRVYNLGKDFMNPNKMIAIFLIVLGVVMNQPYLALAGFGLFVVLPASAEVIPKKVFRHTASGVFKEVLPIFGTLFGVLMNKKKKRRVNKEGLCDKALKFMARIKAFKEMEAKEEFYYNSLGTISEKVEIIDKNLVPKSFCNNPFARLFKYTKERHTRPKDKNLIIAKNINKNKNKNKNKNSVKINKNIKIDKNIKNIKTDKNIILSEKVGTADAARKKSVKDFLKSSDVWGVHAQKCSCAQCRPDGFVNPHLEKVKGCLRKFKSKLLKIGRLISERKLNVQLQKKFSKPASESSWGGSTIGLNTWVEENFRAFAAEVLGCTSQEKVAAPVTMSTIDHCRAYKVCGFLKTRRCRIYKVRNAKQVDALIKRSFVVEGRRPKKVHRNQLWQWVERELPMCDKKWVECKLPVHDKERVERAISLPMCNKNSVKAENKIYNKNDKIYNIKNNKIDKNIKMEKNIKINKNIIYRNYKNIVNNIKSNKNKIVDIEEKTVLAEKEALAAPTTAALPASYKAVFISGGVKTIEVQHKEVLAKTMKTALPAKRDRVRFKPKFFDKEKFKKKKEQGKIRRPKDVESKLVSQFLKELEDESAQKRLAGKAEKKVPVLRMPQRGDVPVVEKVKTLSASTARLLAGPAVGADVVRKQVSASTPVIKKVEMATIEEAFANSRKEAESELLKEGYEPTYVAKVMDAIDESDDDDRPIEEVLFELEKDKYFHGLQKSSMGVSPFSVKSSKPCGDDKRGKAVLAKIVWVSHEAEKALVGSCRPIRKRRFHIKRPSRVPRKPDLSHLSVEERSEIARATARRVYEEVMAPCRPKAMEVHKPRKGDMSIPAPCRSEPSRSNPVCVRENLEGEELTALLEICSGMGPNDPFELTWPRTKGEKLLSDDVKRLGFGNVSDKTKKMLLLFEYGFNIQPSAAPPKPKVVAQSSGMRVSSFIPRSVWLALTIFALTGCASAEGAGGANSMNPLSDFSAYRSWLMTQFTWLFTHDHTSSLCMVPITFLTFIGVILYFKRWGDGWKRCQPLRKLADERAFGVEEPADVKVVRKVKVATVQATRRVVRPPVTLFCVISSIYFSSLFYNVLFSNFSIYFILIYIFQLFSLNLIKNIYKSRDHRMFEHSYLHWAEQHIELFEFKVWLILAYLIAFPLQFHPIILFIVPYSLFLHFNSIHVVGKDVLFCWHIITGSYKANEDLVVTSNMEGFVNRIVCNGARVGVCEKHNGMSGKLVDGTFISESNFVEGWCGSVKEHTLPDFSYTPNMRLSEEALQTHKAYFRWYLEQTRQPKFGGLTSKVEDCLQTVFYNSMAPQLVAGLDYTFLEKMNVMFGNTRYMDNFPLVTILPSNLNYIVQLSRGHKNGFGFVWGGVLYSCHHVTKGKMVRGRLLDLGKFSNFSIRCSWNAKGSYGDMVTYGGAPCLDVAEIDDIVFVANPMLQQILVFQVVTPKTNDVSTQLRFRRLVKMNDPDNSESVEYFDLYGFYGWSGLPIINTAGRPVGVYGYIKVEFSDETGSKVNDIRCYVCSPQAESSGNYHDWASKAKELVENRENMLIQHVYARTGSGKSTYLILEYCRCRMPQIGNSKLVKKIYVLSPLKAGPPLISNYVNDVILNDMELRNRVHAWFSTGDESNVPNSYNMPSGLNIIYMTYGKFFEVHFHEIEKVGDMIFLDEIHYETPDVIAVVDYVQAWTKTLTDNHWKSRFVMLTATPKGQAAETMKNVRVIKPSWGDDIKERVASGDLTSSRKFLRIGKKTCLWFPLEITKENRKIIIFVATKGECDKMKSNLEKALPSFPVFKYYSGLENGSDQVNRFNTVEKGLIICTNAAESALTFRGLDTCFDSLEEMRIYTDPMNDFSERLILGIVSKKSHLQRLGRIGRGGMPAEYYCDMSALNATSNEIPIDIGLKARVVCKWLYKNCAGDTPGYEETYSAIRSCYLKDSTTDMSGDMARLLSAGIVNPISWYYAKENKLWNSADVQKQWPNEDRKRLNIHDWKINTYFPNSFDAVPNANECAFLTNPQTWEEFSKELGNYGLVDVLSGLNNKGSKFTRILSGKQLNSLLAVGSVTGVLASALGFMITLYYAVEGTLSHTKMDAVWVMTGNHFLSSVFGCDLTFYKNYNTAMVTNVTENKDPKVLLENPLAQITHPGSKNILLKDAICAATTVIRGPSRLWGWRIRTKSDGLILASNKVGKEKTCCMPFKTTPSRFLPEYHKLLESVKEQVFCGNRFEDALQSAQKNTPSAFLSVLQVVRLFTDEFFAECRVISRELTPRWDLSKKVVWGKWLQFNLQNLMGVTHEQYIIACPNPDAFFMIWMWMCSNDFESLKDTNPVVIPLLCSDMYLLTRTRCDPKELTSQDSLSWLWAGNTPTEDEKLRLALTLNGTIDLESPDDGPSQLNSLNCCDYVQVREAFIKTFASCKEFVAQHWPYLYNVVCGLNVLGPLAIGIFFDRVVVTCGMSVATIMTMGLFYILNNPMTSLIRSFGILMGTYIAKHVAGFKTIDPKVLREIAPTPAILLGSAGLGVLLKEVISKHQYNITPIEAQLAVKNISAVPVSQTNLAGLVKNLFYLYYKLFGEGAKVEGQDWVNILMNAGVSVYRFHGVPMLQKIAAVIVVGSIVAVKFAITKTDAIMRLVHLKEIKNSEAAIDALNKLEQNVDAIAMSILSTVALLTDPLSIVTVIVNVITQIFAAVIGGARLDRTILLDVLWDGFQASAGMPIWSGFIGGIGTILMAFQLMPRPTTTWTQKNSVAVGISLASSLVGVMPHLISFLRSCFQKSSWQNAINHVTGVCSDVTMREKVKGRALEIIQIIVGWFTALYDRVAGLWKTSEIKNIFYKWQDFSTMLDKVSGQPEQWKKNHLCWHLGLDTSNPVLQSDQVFDPYKGINDSDVTSMLTYGMARMRESQPVQILYFVHTTTNTIDLEGIKTEVEKQIEVEVDLVVKDTGYALSNTGTFRYVPVVLPDGFYVLVEMYVDKIKDYCYVLVRFFDQQFVEVRLYGGKLLSTAASMFGNTILDCAKSIVEGVTNTKMVRCTPEEKTRKNDFIKIAKLLPEKSGLFSGGIFKGVRGIVKSLWSSEVTREDELEELKTWKDHLTNDRWRSLHDSVFMTLHSTLLVPYLDWAQMYESYPAKRPDILFSHTALIKASEQMHWVKMLPSWEATVKMDRTAPERWRQDIHGHLAMISEFRRLCAEWLTKANWTFQQDDLDLVLFRIWEAHMEKRLESWTPASFDQHYDLILNWDWKDSIYPFEAFDELSQLEAFWCVACTYLPHFYIRKLDKEYKETKKIRVDPDQMEQIWRRYREDKRHWKRWFVARMIQIAVSKWDYFGRFVERDWFGKVAGWNTRWIPPCYESFIDEPTYFPRESYELNSSSETTIYDCVCRWKLADVLRNFFEDVQDTSPSQCCLDPVHEAQIGINNDFWSASSRLQKSEPRANIVEKPRHYKNIPPTIISSGKELSLDESSHRNESPNKNKKTKIAGDAAYEDTQKINKNNRTVGVSGVHSANASANTNQQKLNKNDKTGVRPLPTPHILEKDIYSINKYKNIDMYIYSILDGDTPLTAEKRWFNPAIQCVNLMEGGSEKILDYYYNKIYSLQKQLVGMPSRTKNKIKMQRLKYAGQRSVGLSHTVGKAYCDLAEIDMLVKNIRIYTLNDFGEGMMTASKPGCYHKNVLDLTPGLGWSTRFLVTSCEKAFVTYFQETDDKHQMLAENRLPTRYTYVNRVTKIANTESVAPYFLTSQNDKVEGLYDLVLCDNSDMASDISAASLGSSGRRTTISHIHNKNSPSNNIYNNIICPKATDVNDTSQGGEETDRSRTIQEYSSLIRCGYKLLLGAHPQHLFVYSISDPTCFDQVKWVFLFKNVMFYWSTTCKVGLIRLYAVCRNPCKSVEQILSEGFTNIDAYLENYVSQHHVMCTRLCINLSEYAVRVLEQQNNNVLSKKRLRAPLWYPSPHTGLMALDEFRAHEQKVRELTGDNAFLKEVETMGGRFMHPDRQIGVQATSRLLRGRHHRVHAIAKSAEIRLESAAKIAGLFQYQQVAGCYTRRNDRLQKSSRLQCTAITDTLKPLGWYLDNAVITPVSKDRAKVLESIVARFDQPPHVHHDDVMVQLYHCAWSILKNDCPKNSLDIWPFEQAKALINRQGAAGMLDEWSDMEGCLNDPRTPARVASLLSRLAAREDCSEYYVTVHNKVESKANDRASEGELLDCGPDTLKIRPRLISYFGCVARIVDWMVFGPMVHHHYKVSKLIDHTTGGTPIFEVGDKLKACFDAFEGGVAATGDASKFDHSQTIQDKAIECEIVTSFYKPECWPVIETIYEHVMWSVAFTRLGFCYNVYGHRLSGWILTWWNSFTMAMFCDWAWKTTLNIPYDVKMADVVSLHNVVKEYEKASNWVGGARKHLFSEDWVQRSEYPPVIFNVDGDDNVHFGPANIVTEENLRKMAANLRKLNITIRSKTHSGFVRHEHFDTVDFLSHTFQRVYVRQGVTLQECGMDEQMLAPPNGNPVVTNVRTHWCRVRYLPVRPLSEIMAKMSFTIRAACTSNTLEAAWKMHREGVICGVYDKKHPLYGKKSFEGVEIEASKALSYLLLYPHIDTVRTVALTVLAQLGFPGDAKFWKDYRHQMIFGSDVAETILELTANSKIDAEVSETFQLNATEEGTFSPLFNIGRFASKLFEVKYKPGPAAPQTQPRVGVDTTSTIGTYKKKRGEEDLPPYPYADGRRHMDRAVDEATKPRPGDRAFWKGRGVKEGRTTKNAMSGRGVVIMKEVTAMLTRDGKLGYLDKNQIERSVTVCSALRSIYGGSVYSLADIGLVKSAWEDSNRAQHFRNVCKAADKGWPGHNNRFELRRFQTLTSPESCNARCPNRRVRRMVLLHALMRQQNIWTKNVGEVSMDNFVLPYDFYLALNPPLLTEYIRCVAPGARHFLLKKFSTKGLEDYWHALKQEPAEYASDMLSHVLQRGKDIFTGEAVRVLNRIRGKFVPVDQQNSLTITKFDVDLAKIPVWMRRKLSPDKPGYEEFACLHTHATDCVKSAPGLHLPQDHVSDLEKDKGESPSSVLGDRVRYCVVKDGNRVMDSYLERKPCPTLDPLLHNTAPIGKAFLRNVVSKLAYYCGRSTALILLMVLFTFKFAVRQVGSEFLTGFHKQCEMHDLDSRKLADNVKVMYNTTSNVFKASSWVSSSFSAMRMLCEGFLNQNELNDSGGPGHKPGT